MLDVHVVLLREGQIENAEWPVADNQHKSVFTLFITVHSGVSGAKWFR